MTEEDSFSFSCKIAVEYAKKTGVVQYVFDLGGCWKVSNIYHRSWVFKEHPGGRTIRRRRDEKEKAP